MAKLIPIIFFTCFLCVNFVENFMFDMMPHEFHDYNRLRSVSDPPDDWLYMFLLNRDENNYLDRERIDNMIRKKDYQKDILEPLEHNGELIKSIAMEVVENNKQWQIIFKILSCLVGCVPLSFIKKDLDGKALLYYLGDRIIQIPKNADANDQEYITKMAGCVDICLTKFE